jgi:transcriptional regulator NrdR family protein
MKCPRCGGTTDRLVSTGRLSEDGKIMFQCEECAKKEASKD